jgi:heme-degrading monooxygenase HmoA
MEVMMFVAVVRFPAIPADSDADFREWFAWSNVELRNAPGLVGRRLLHGGDRSYVGLVEHENMDTFVRMHGSPAASEVQRRLLQLTGDGPQAETYEVVEDAGTASCCGSHHGEAGPEPETLAVGGGGCCGAS